jgi:hypothetical protein
MFSLLFLDRGWGVEWILKLAAAGDEGPCVDIMEISKPDDLGDIANLVPRVVQNAGYNLFSFTRASPVVNCQSALV